MDLWFQFYFSFDVIMRDSGICPKCGSKHIWNPENQKGFGIGRGIWFKVTTWQSARMIPYICLDCNYSELYCADDGIETIKKQISKQAKPPETKNCPICGFENPSTSEICNECGSVLE